jgi:hypothetical protein
VRLSEFWIAMDDEFGAYGRVLSRDLVLSSIGSRTAEQALAAGVPVREIWLAMCAAQDVPRERWHGVGLREPRT